MDDFYKDNRGETEEQNTDRVDTNSEMNQTSPQINYSNAYDSNYQSKDSAMNQEQPTWQPGTGASFAEHPEGKKTNKKKKEKHKKPLTMGRVVRTCVGFMLITVLINGGILYAALRTNIGGYVTSEDYHKRTSIQSTQNNLNNMQSNSEVVTTDKASTGTLSVSEVSKAVLPSVVSITSTSIYKSNSNPFMYGGTYQVNGAGSGIIIGTNETELLIATNNHVVEDTTSLTVEFVDGSSLDTAYIKGTNSSNDIAVIAVKLSEISDETSKEISIATLGDSNELEVGDQVIAIGNALGYGQSVTVGYVSALNRELTVENTTISAIQTDASINGGNSGGALLNMKGEVVGINFAKQSSNSMSSSSIEGMGYAIPISHAKDILTELMNKEVKEKVDEDEKGYMGITSAISIDASVKQMYNIPEGAYMRGIAEGSPADKAGIQIGDVIVALDGEDIDSYDELQDRMNYYAAGETVTLTVMRAKGNEYIEKEMKVTLCSYDELNELIKK